MKFQDGLLKQVFEEQYVVEHGQVTPRDKKAIAADRVQNPNDPDAEYRQKGQQKVRSYSVNITETTDQDDAPSMITGVQVEGATAADNAFYGDAIAKSDGDTVRITDTRTGEVYEAKRTKGGCRGLRLPALIPHPEQQDPLQRQAEARTVGFCPQHMDQSAKNRALP